MNSYCNPANMDISYDSVENAACSDIESSYYGTSKRYFMPYLDHCYASGLPTIQFDSHPDSPPLPLTEPLAAFVDIEEVGTRGGLHHHHAGLGGVVPSSSTGKRNTGVGNSSSTKNSGHNNVISNNGGGDAEVDPYEGSVTRCICDFQHDDGYMICCDRCGVWQHVECMGIDGKHIPDSYLCELCYPRLVDKRRAVRIQSKKKEELDMEESSASADDSLEEESKRPKRKGGRKDHGRRKSGGGSGADRCDPGGGGNRKSQQQRRKRTSSEIDGKKHSDGAFHSTNKGTDQKRSRPQSFSTLENQDIWNVNSTFDKLTSGHEHVIQQTGASPMSGGGEVIPIQPNTYSAEVLSLLVMKVKAMGGSSNSNVAAIAQQLSRKCYKVITYEDTSKGLEATETIKPNHMVAEYTGKTVMRREYERNCQSDLSYPFTVCYMGINGVELCVDSTDFNNESKFVRRSCIPNAKVVHLLEKTGLRFFICATKTIPSGKEITIPFYFDYQRSSVEVKCPCGKFNCMVAKHFKRMSGKSTTSTATVASTTATTSATTATSTTGVSQRPVRQSKKRVFEEYVDNGGEEEEEDEDAGRSSTQLSTSSDRYSSAASGQQSPTKKRNLGEQHLTEQEQEVNDTTTTTTLGRVVKSPRGRQTTQQNQTTNNSDKHSLHSVLQAHLARNMDLTKTSLAPMSANVGDDIALFNKLSSVDPLRLTSKADQSENANDSRRKSNENERKWESQQDEQQSKVLIDEKHKVSTATKESNQPNSTGASKRKQQFSQLKEGKTESETKEKLLDNGTGSTMKEDKTAPVDDTDQPHYIGNNNNNINNNNKPAPKEKRKNSKLLAEIQTFFKADKLGEEKDSGSKKVSTREQRKIEAAEKRFEKIEKSSAKVNSKVAATATVGKSMKTRSGQLEDKKVSEQKLTKEKPGQKIMGNMGKVAKGGSGKNTGGKSRKEEGGAEKSMVRQVDKKSKAVAVPSRTTRSSKK